MDVDLKSMVTANFLLFLMPSNLISIVVYIPALSGLGIQGELVNELKHSYYNYAVSQCLIYVYMYIYTHACKKN